MKAKKYLLLVILIAIPNSLAMYTNYNSDYSFQEAESADISSDVRRAIEEIEDPELRDSFHKQWDATENLYDAKRKVSIIMIILCVVGVIIVMRISKKEQESKMLENIEMKNYRGTMLKMAERELSKENRTASKLETCENCGRTIGKLEQAHIFKGNVVCEKCSQRLGTNQKDV